MNFLGLFFKKLTKKHKLFFFQYFFTKHAKYEFINKSIGNNFRDIIYFFLLGSGKY